MENVKLKCEDTIDILKRLIKEGTVKNVNSFGESQKGLAVPYVLIIPYSESPDKQAYQVWAHFQVGKNKELEKYIKKELPTLIFAKKNILGQTYFKSNATYDSVSFDSRDATIRAGKVFYLPLIIR